MTGTGMLAGTQTSGCSTSPPPQVTSEPTTRPAAPADKSVLLAYFSRPGGNYHYGGRTQLEVGNTEVVAQTISSRIECDLYRIQPADPYPDDYEQTVARNRSEEHTSELQS